MTCADRRYSQDHILNHCNHCAMETFRFVAIEQIRNHLHNGMAANSIDGSDKVYGALHSLWVERGNRDIDFVIGRWNPRITDDFIAILRNSRYSGTALTISNTINLAYQPIKAYVYLAHTLRIRLILNDGRVTSLWGPEKVVGKWFNDLTLPTEDIMSSTAPSIDSDWIDEELSSAPRQMQIQSQLKRCTLLEPIKRQQVPQPTAGWSFQTEEIPAEHSSRPSLRVRPSRVTEAQIKDMVALMDTRGLNELAVARKLEGVDKAEIAVDPDGFGLCLLSTKTIHASATKPRKLWEYSGICRVVQPKENCTSIPIGQLKYGCEFRDKGITYRRAPSGPLDGISQYIQEPPVGVTPHCYLATDERSLKTYVMISKSIRPGEKYTMSYGLPYWQLFWTHRSIEDQIALRNDNPQVRFPPIWPAQLPTIPNRQDHMRLEWDYSLASVNIYDELDEINETDVLQTPSGNSTNTSGDIEGNPSIDEGSD